MLHETFNNREFLGSNPVDSKYLSSPIYTYYQYGDTGVVWEGDVRLYSGYGRLVESFSYVRFLSFGVCV